MGIQRWASGMTGMRPCPGTADFPPAAARRWLAVPQVTASSVVMLLGAPTLVAAVDDRVAPGRLGDGRPRAGADGRVTVHVDGAPATHAVRLAVLL